MIAICSALRTLVQDCVWLCARMWSVAVWDGLSVRTWDRALALHRTHPGGPARALVGAEGCTGMGKLTVHFLVWIGALAMSICISVQSSLCVLLQKRVFLPASPCPALEAGLPRPPSGESHHCHNFSQFQLCAFCLLYGISLNIFLFF